MPNVTGNCMTCIHNCFAPLFGDVKCLIRQHIIQDPENETACPDYVNGVPVLSQENEDKEYEYNLKNE